jgi:Ca-activated chloride channel family protein
LQQVTGEPQDKGAHLRRFLLAACLAGLPSTANACEIALALAIDVSGSVDADEYYLQMQGLADALRDSTIVDALVKAQAKVTLIQWTGDSRQIVSVPWTETTNIADVEGLAVAVETAPRRWRHFSTAIGAALDFTVAEFNGITDCARHVIDVSGDGPSNEGVEPEQMRSQIWRAGITVNGLAIETNDDDLTTYYWENVVVGEQAFVMTANGFEDYPKRIKLKLLREVTQQVSQTPVAPKIIPVAQLP